MHERAMLIDAALEIGNARDAGCEVRLDVPLVGSQ
jgi:nitrate/nitrite-specific signal transduction histidine kinase